MRKTRHALEILLIVVVVAVLAASHRRSQAPTGAELNERVHRNLARAYKEKRYHDCLDITRERLSADQADLFALRYQAMCLAELGDPKKAEALFSEGIRGASGPMADYLYANRLGRLHLERGRLRLRQLDPHGALADFRAVKDLFLSEIPEAEVASLMAQAQFACGDAKGAWTTLTMTGDPENQSPETRRHLALLDRRVNGSATPIPAETCPGSCLICSPRPAKDFKPAPSPSPATTPHSAMTI